VVFGIVIWGCAATLIWVRAPVLYGGGGNDFWNFFYPTGRQVLSGHLHYATPARYTPQNVGIFRYPPFAGLLFALFAWLPKRSAELAFWAFNVGAVVVIGVLLATRFSARWPTRNVIAAVVVLGLAAFAPLDIALPVQIDPFILLLLVGAYCCMEGSGKRRWAPAGAGILLGVAIAIKVYPVLALAVLVWLRREQARQILAGAAAALIATTAVTVVVLGAAPFGRYAHVATAQSSPVLTGFQGAFGILNLATRVLTRNPYTTGSLDLPSSVPRIIFIVAVLAGLTALAWRYRTLRASPAAAWTAALGAAIIGSPFLEVQHLAALAIVPILIAIDVTHAHGWRALRYRDAPGGLGTLVALGASCVVCTLAVRGISHHLGEALSVAVALGAGAIMWRAATGAASRLRIAWLAVGAFFVLLATPSFAAMSAFWGVPMSVKEAIIGSGELLAAAALVTSVVFLNGGVEVVPAVVELGDGGPGVMVTR
jgi:hypothetical protein